MLNIETKMEAFARTYSKDTGVQIKMGNNFCTDGKTIYIVPVTDRHDAWIRFQTEVICYHETGHIVTGDAPYHKAIHDSTKRHIFNVVRDVVVENVMETEYKGLKDKWIQFLTTFMSKTNYYMRPEFNQLVGLLYLRGREQLLGITLKINVKPSVLEVFEKRLAKFVNPICQHTDINTSLTITEEIFDALKEPQQNSKSSGKSNKDARKQDSSSKDAEESDSIPNDVPEDNDSSDEGGTEESDIPSDQESDEDEGSKTSGDDGDDTGDGETEPVSEDQSGTGNTGTDEESGDDPESDEELSDEAEAELKKILEQALHGQTGQTVSEEAVAQINKYAATNQIYRAEQGLKEDFYKISAREGWEDEVAGYETEGRKMVGFLGGKLKNLFISERAPTIVRGTRSGRLDIRKLHKIQTGSKDLYYRKTQGKYEDACVYEVIDNSGSMEDYGKSIIAQSILTAVSNDLDKLRIPFGAVGFTSDNERSATDGVRRTPCTLNQIKGFEEPYRRCRHRFVWPDMTSGTVELPAIQYAANQLVQRRETKKVLFILTDGGTGSGNDTLNNVLRVATKEFIERLVRAGVKVVGIGIIDNAIRDYCSDFIHVTDLSKFASEFYHKLTKLLL